MFLNEVDSQLISSLNCFYASDNTNKGDPLPLQLYLEEAIKSKCGQTKDLTSLISVAIKKKRAEYATFTSTLEEGKGSSSDNELELDLLKEDLMCIICNGMDVGARNRLLECADCHMLYHQECHKPMVVDEDTFDDWTCQNCKDANQKNSSNCPSASSSPTSVILSTSNPSSGTSKSSGHRHGSSSSGSKSKSDKQSKSSSGKSSSSSGKSSNTAPSSRSNVIPNINIISADKRLQIMKKKAAKMQEKRKTNR